MKICLFKQNIIKKFMKISKIGFSIQHFMADFWQFSSTTVKTCLLGGQVVTSHQFKLFQAFSQNCIIFEGPQF